MKAKNNNNMLLDFLKKNWIQCLEKLMNLLKQL